MYTNSHATHAEHPSQAPGATGPRRPALAFDFDGVPERERTLFKSFVRLIDHRTRHAWALTHDGHVDLRVVSAATPAAGDAAAVLILGEHGAADGGLAHRGVLWRQLRLPIHAGELEEVLDALGGAVLRHRQAHGDAARAMDADAHVRLLRWPAPSLMTSRDHVRLAALLTGRPASAREISARTGLPSDVCVAFLLTLEQAGLLDHSSDPQPQSPAGQTAQAERPAARARAAAAPTSGLLARIRQRLGLGLMAQA